MMKDPYKYFRIEAQELLDALVRGVLELERGAGDPDLLQNLLRHAHTLKGAARIVKQSHISELSHRIEDLLAPYRERPRDVPQAEISTLLGLLDAIAAQLRLLRGGDAPPVAPAQPAVAPEPPAQSQSIEELEAIRVEVGALDALLQQLSEAAANLAAMREESAEILSAMRAAAHVPQQPAAAISAGPRETSPDPLRTASRQLQQLVSDRLDRAERDLAAAVERCAELRLLPAGIIFSLLGRIARDAAAQMGLQLHFDARGGEQRLDSHVLRNVRDALVHVVRNAVAHGLEPAAQRIAAGKPPEGLIQLRVERQGELVSFTCRDDGRGIDLERLRQLVVERNLVSPADAATLDADRLMAVIGGAGLTTAPAVTELAGRGIGLNAIREIVGRIKGDLSIETQSGRGTTVDLRVPISMESISVLEVRVQGMGVLCIPTASIVRTLRIADERIQRWPSAETIHDAGRDVPFMALGDLLGRPSPPVRSWSVVLVQSRGSWAALGVEQLLRRATVVMRPLPPGAARSPLVAGASLSADGEPRLVLSAAAMVESIAARRTVGVAEPPRRPPLLVVDDSLTTRMLEQSILETAGYEVDLAASGEEALRKARQRRYAMFIVDVEMPGMDGFALVERLRADPDLRSSPAILVTSRAAPEDKRRGLEVGARAYIVKSEFDQGQLLSVIRGLVG